MGALRGSVCRGSSVPVLQGNPLELLEDGQTARFRSNDHGALRALRAVYASRDTPLWVVDGQPTPAALALLRTLQQADGYGLEPRDYGTDELVALVTSAFGAARELATAGAADPQEVRRSVTWVGQRRIAFDVGLSAAALKLLCDLHYGRIDPRAAGFDLGSPRPDDLDLSRELVAL